MIDNDETDRSSNRNSMKNKRPIASISSAAETQTKKLKKDLSTNDEQQKQNATKKISLVENKSSTKNLEQNSSTNKEPKNKKVLLEPKENSSKPTTKIIRAQSTGDLKLCIQTKPIDDVKKRNSSPPVVKNKNSSNNAQKTTPNKSSALKKPSPSNNKSSKPSTIQSNNLPSASNTVLANKSIPIKKKLPKISSDETTNNVSTKPKLNIPQVR